MVSVRVFSLVRGPSFCFIWAVDKFPNTHQRLVIIRANAGLWVNRSSIEPRQAKHQARIFPACGTVLGDVVTLVRACVPGWNIRTEPMNDYDPSTCLSVWGEPSPGTNICSNLGSRFGRYSCLTVHTHTYKPSNGNVGRRRAPAIHKRL